MTIDSFKNEDEREAWTKAYRCFQIDQRPPNAVCVMLDEAAAGTGARAFSVHPLAKELLYELFETLPERLHDALAAGWHAALMDRPR